MTKQEVLVSLKYFTKEFPTAALQEVQTKRLEYIPELLESLEYVYNHPYELQENGNNYYLHIYAMYLLAEFREKQAFSRLVRLLTLQEDALDTVIGETLTAGFPQLLLSTYDSENIQMLFDVIENPELYEFARNAAVRAYGLLFMEGCITREECVSYFRSLIYGKLHAENSEPVYTSIVSEVIESRFDEMIPDVKFLYDNEVVDIWVNGEYDEFLGYIYSDVVEKRPSYINDAVSAMCWWACFTQNKQQRQLPTQKKAAITTKIDKKDSTRKEIKENLVSLQKQKLQKQKGIGMNKPCPCGSGKKYKNCCFTRS